MSLNEKRQPDRTARAGVLIVAVALLLGAAVAQADTTYLRDGAVPNSRGGWDLPKQGSCPADLTATTRGACIARRYNTAEDACTGNYSWSTGVCTDLVNTTQVACEAQPDRFWNAGSGVCAIVMLGDDRNDVSCALHGGTWVTTGACTGNWVMPPRDDAAYGSTAWGSGLLTSNSAGDQCLRCHNSVTQYNSPRVRDTEDTIYMGHKNMARAVQPPLVWGGPPFSCTGHPAATTEEACRTAGGTWDPRPYPSDDGGNLINWAAGTINVAGIDYSLKWIYGDWLGPLPRAIYIGDAVHPNTPSYSCGRCHTTGWTSDAGTVANVKKDPEYTFPGISWTGSGVNKVKLAGGVTGDANILSSWDVWGISCTRCHNSAADTTTHGGVPAFTAPPGMSTHHNNLTGADNTGGVCSDARWTAETQCTGAGGTWITNCSIATAAVCIETPATNPGLCPSGGTWVAAATPWCSNAFYSGQTACEANGYVWMTGWCTRAFGSSSTCAPSAPQTANVVSIVVASNVATVTTTAAHNLTPSEWVTISGAIPTLTFNGSFQIASVPTATTLTYPLTAPDGSAIASSSGIKWVPARAWRTNGSQASCQVGGGTWASLSKCSVEGVCNLGPGYTPAACAAAGGQFRYATDVIRCEDAGGRWTGNNTNRGQIITRVCMDCHRQETGGLPYDSTNPATALKVGPAHSTVAFVSHTAGNLFLNSPHGKFTGTFAQIPTGKFKYDMTGEYTSFFMADAEAANTGNGCTGCHEVHTSVVAGERPFREECTACHAKNLNLINHPKGTGTPIPFEILGTPEEFEACVSCHMPDAQHLFRISVDPAYSTFPMPAALSSTVNANTAPDGSYTNAVWADLDHACGQCHGGGTSQATDLAGRVDLKFAEQGVTGAVSCASVGGTWDAANNRCTIAATGSADCASKAGSWNSTTSICTLTAGRYLQVGSTTGFTVGQKIRVPDAGALSYDGNPPVVLPGDFDSYVFSTTLGGPNRIVLVGAPSNAVIGKKVVQNATSNNASWFSKTILAGYAAGIHNDAPLALFTASYGADGATVVVDASQSKCNGSNANCNVFDWNWGDGSPNGSGVTATHTYAPTPPSQTFVITLTVTQYGMEPGVATRNFTAYVTDNPPVASGSCSVDYATWTATCSNTATDDNGFQLVSINWGDGTVVTNVTSAPWGGPFTHTFIVPGNFNIKLKVVDTSGQSSTATIGSTVSASFQYFAVSGTVYKKDGTTPLGAVQIQVKRGGVLVRSVMSAANGTYSVPNLKPGTYTLTASKFGYTFANPTATVTVPPNATNVNLVATGP